jgi:type IV secretory pathway TrbD component
MPALREVFAEYDIVFDRRRNLQRGNRQVSATRRVLTRLKPAVTAAARALTGFAALAGGAAVVGLGRIVSSTSESIRELDRWSGRLGINRDALQSWVGLGAEYGADIDDVTDALKEMQLKAQDAISGGTAQAEMFQRIGISLDDLRPVVNDSERLMALFIGRLGQVEDQALRNFTTDELMSDAGTRMNQVFALGNTEIARRRAAISATLGPTRRLSRAVAEHTRRVREMVRRWTAFKRAITLHVLPIIDQIGEKLTALVGPIRDVVTETNLLEGALVAVGIVGAVAAALTIEVWGPVVVALAAVAAAVAVVAAAYDQLSRTIEGGDTALRTFLDDSDRLGEGGTTGAILLLGDAWLRVSRGATICQNNVKAFLSVLPQIATAIGNMFPALRLAIRLVGALGTGLERVAQFAGIGFRLRTAEEQTQNRRRAAHHELVRQVGGVERSRRFAEQEDFAAGRTEPVTGLPASRRREVYATPRRSAASTTTVHAPVNMPITITESPNADRTRRIVGEEVTTRFNRLTRELESMNQPVEASS